MVGRPACSPSPWYVPRWGRFPAIPMPAKPVKSPAKRASSPNPKAGSKQANSSKRVSKVLQDAASAKAIDVSDAIMTESERFIALQIAEADAKEKELDDLAASVEQFRSEGMDASDPRLVQAEADLAAKFQEIKDLTSGAMPNSPALPKAASPKNKKKKKPSPAASPQKDASPQKGLSAEGAFDEGVDATLEAVSNLLHKLELSTLQQALVDLGLPTDGGKRELSERITNALQP